MEEFASAAYKAIVAEQSAQTDELLAKIGRLEGALCATRIILDGFMRRATPEARTETIIQIRKLLAQESPEPPSTFDDGFESAAKKLLTRLDGS